MIGAKETTEATAISRLIEHIKTISIFLIYVQCLEYDASKARKFISLDLVDANSGVVGFEIQAHRQMSFPWIVACLVHAAVLLARNEHADKLFQGPPCRQMD